MKKEKKNQGITLIALVITIIVLLILAGVTIATLTGDNGLLTKATNSKEKNEEAGICENIKLAYGEYQIAQHTGTEKTAEKIIEDNLKSTYGDNIQKVKVKNEKVIVNINVNNVQKTYIYKINTDEAFEYIDIIDYKGKEKKNLVKGDDISIGNENFRVFYNQEGVIKAMPFYNLKLDSDSIRQATEEEAINEQEGTVTFSDSIFWEMGQNINMLEKKEDNSGYKNNVQRYIDVYEKTLEKLGQKGIEVRIPKDGEIYFGSAWYYCVNPGQKGTFWTSTCSNMNINYLDYVTSKGEMYAIREYYTLAGVRPIIVIEY